MKKLLFIISSILLCCCQQKTDNDTITTKGELPLNVRIARDSTTLSLPKRKQLLEKGLEELNLTKNDSIYLENLSKVSLISIRLKDSLLFRKVNNQVYQEALKKENYKVLGESQWDLAVYYKQKSTLDSAYYYYRKAYQHFAQMPIDSTSKSLKARMLYSMGQMQEDFKDYLGAEANITKAIRIYDDLEDTRRLQYSYNVLGVISSA
ncbi:MAG: hypothetical protein AAGD88_07515, partial [Bacteroidota bacterium]